MAQRKIAVVHLVREATVLRLASMQQSNKQKEMHVTDAQHANDLAAHASPLHLASVEDVQRQVRAFSLRRDGSVPHAPSCYRTTRC